MSDGNNEQLVRALQKMWRKELEASLAYRQVARMEPDERRRAILNKLADVEEGHAAAWAMPLCSNFSSLPAGRICRCLKPRVRWHRPRS